jgi:hypothetical protein
MDRQAAEAIMRHTDAIDLLLGAMGEIIREHGPESARDEMLEAVFYCVTTMYDKVSRPVFEIYPDLHPDEECRPPKSPSAEN